MKTGIRTEGRSCVRTRGGLPGVAVRPRPCAVAKPVGGRGSADRGHVSYKLGVLKATPWASPRELPSLGGRGHCHTWPGGALHRGEGRVERRAGFVTMAVGLARSVKGETFLDTSCSS